MNRLLALTASLFLLAHEAAAVERVLVFDDVKKTDLQANFQSDCVATQPPANFQKLQRVPTKTNAFFLYFDPTLIEPARFGRFFDYTFYISVAGANPPVWHSCGTQVYTQGAFSRSLGDGAFHRESRQCDGRGRVGRAAAQHRQP